MKAPIDFSRPFDELVGGGSFFEPGLYVVNLSHFTYYNFNGKGDPALSLMQELQPLNVEGEAEGDVVTRYFPLGGKTKEGIVLVEPCDPIKGRDKAWKSIRFTEHSKNDKLMKGTEFTVFLQYAQKNGVDMDSIANDWTGFEGNTYEYGVVSEKRVTKKKTAVETAEGGDTAPAKDGSDMKDYVVIVGQPKKSKGATKSKAKPQAEEADEKPAKKDAAKSSSKKPKGPAGLIAEYIDEHVKPEVKKDDEADWMSHKISCAKWLKNEKELDADDVKAAMKVYNDTEEALPAVLDTLGLKLNKDGDTFVSAE